METPTEILTALGQIADDYNPLLGRWAYRAFDAINSTFFDGRLPRRFIQWAITPHSKCLGQTMAKLSREDRPVKGGPCHS
jgi:hypothetical protein